jgi:hypothetical protein
MESINLSKNIFYAIAFLLVFFTACKDKNEDPKPDNPGENPTENTLTANAGQDTTVQAGTLVKLNGSGSKDSKNQPFTYQWTVVTKPSGSIANIMSPTTVRPTFTPDKTGEYEIELTIANEKHQSKDRMKITSNVATPLDISSNITVQTILEDRIADPELPDYYVTTDISVTSELTIKPGVVIGFNRNTLFSISPDGLIIAEGTADKKIKFVGKEDKSGFWRGMIIYSASNENIINHVEITNAGSNTVLSATKAALTLFGGNKTQLAIKNTKIYKNDGYGFFASSGSVIREFANNEFSQNTEAGILLSAEMVSKLDYQSKFTGQNGRDVVEVFSSTIQNVNDADHNWKGFADKSAYFITGEFTVRTGWKLDPGVTIKVGRNVRIAVEQEGFINAVGTTTDKVVITGAQATAGYWRGLIIYTTSNQNIFKNVEISYGGSNALVSGKVVNLAVYGTNATISMKDCEVKGSAGYGIFVSYLAKINTDVATTNTFSNNTLGAIIDDNK